MQTAVLRSARKTSAAGRRAPLRVLLAGKASAAVFIADSGLLLDYVLLGCHRANVLGCWFGVQSSEWCRNFQGHLGRNTMWFGRSILALTSN
jgi:hypothetical protein